MRSLMEAGANPDLADENKTTALLAASYFGTPFGHTLTTTITPSHHHLRHPLHRPLSHSSIHSLLPHSLTIHSVTDISYSLIDSFTHSLTKTSTHTDLLVHSLSHPLAMMDDDGDDM